MTTLEDFLSKYNTLVIDDEKTSRYQMIHAGSDEVWDTIPTPAHEEDIHSRIANIGDRLSTGRHSLRLQAVSSRGTNWGQFGIDIEGKSAAARNAGNEAVSHAKALRVNVETGEMQLQSMSARLEAANARSAIAEEKAYGSIVNGFAMLDMAHKMMLDREREKMEAEVATKNAETMAMLAATMVPVLNVAVEFGAKYMMWKMAKIEEEWKNPKRPKEDVRVVTEERSTNNKPTEEGKES